jgi:LCP family protein required for cell wall assembly
MKNEFDDELDREKTKRGRRGYNSKPDPSDGDYYLDDDYEDFEERRPGGGNNAPVREGGGRNTGERARNISAPHSSGGNSQPVRRAQSSSGNNSTGQDTSRPRQAPGNTQSRSQSASRGQIVIGDGGSRQQSRIPAQEKPSASSRGASQNGKKRKIKRIILLAIAELFTLALIFSYAYVARIMGAIQRPDDFDKKQVQNEEMSDEQKKHMTGYRTIAIFGVDSRDGNVNKGTNADVIMICNINRDNGEIRLVSIFRDTYLNVSEGNAYNKINSAYANGGASQALAAINKNLDLDISEYVTFNWKSVADGINMLGGVDVDITKAEFRYINSFITETVKKTGVPSVHLKSAGMNHLDGVQAVAYARLRKMDTDYARTERQRLIIQKSFEKAKKADLGLLNRILLMEVEQVGTNLTFSDFTELLLDIGKYHIGETGGFPFSRGDMKMGKKGDCVIPQTLVTNVTELHKFLFEKENYEPSDMVKKISAKIAADSGMYKEGKDADDSSNTKKNNTKKETEETKAVKTTEAEETSSLESSAQETDANGKPIKNGPGTSTGETKETKPGETKQTESSSGTTKPGETKPSQSGGSTETTSASHGPGNNETTAAHETTAPETTKSNSAGPGETTSSQPGNATTGGNVEAPVVPAPPTN